MKISLPAIALLSALAATTASAADVYCPQQITVNCGYSGCAVSSTAPSGLTGFTVLGSDTDIGLGSFALKLVEAQSYNRQFAVCDYYYTNADPQNKHYLYYSLQAKGNFNQDGPNWSGGACLTPQSRTPIESTECAFKPASA
jgi:hypothetical protein